MLKLNCFFDFEEKGLKKVWEKDKKKKGLSEKKL
jgi:hypothetical protein